MKKISFEDLKLPEPKKSRRTQRGDLIEEFMKNLNPPRIEQGRKPLPFAYFARVFSRKSDQQIYIFLQECKKSKIGFGPHYWVNTGHGKKNKEKKLNSLPKVQGEQKGNTPL